MLDKSKTNVRVLNSYKDGGGGGGLGNVLKKSNGN